MTKPLEFQGFLRDDEGMDDTGFEPVTPTMSSQPDCHRTPTDNTGNIAFSVVLTSMCETG
jgi:hypothetical protein